MEHWSGPQSSTAAVLSHSHSRHQRHQGTGKDKVWPEQTWFCGSPDLLFFRDALPKLRSTRMITIGFGMRKPLHSVSEFLDYAAQDKFKSIPSRPPHQVAEVKPRLGRRFLSFSPPKKNGNHCNLEIPAAKNAMGANGHSGISCGPSNLDEQSPGPMAHLFPKGLSQLSSLPKDGVRCGLT